MQFFFLILWQDCQILFSCRNFIQFILSINNKKILHILGSVKNVGLKKIKKKRIFVNWS